MLTAEIISIGDELLIGQIINTNASYISNSLNAIGVDVTRVTTIGDHEKRLTAAIALAWQEHDIVIATGGLGPTHDDISKVIVAKFFKKKLVLHKPTLIRVTARFKSFGIGKMPEANISQAMIPEGFTVLNNDKGTAPGLLYYKGGKTFVILPGVPHEMKWLIEQQVTKLIKKNYARKLGNVILHRTLLTTGIGESLLAEKVGDVTSFLEKGATLAYLPKISGVRMRISVRSSNEVMGKETLRRIEKHIRKQIAPFIFGINENTIEEAVVTLLKKQKATISTAESCTGGMLSMKLTNTAGSSAVFPGGVISYANTVKIKELGVPPAIIKKYGAVSEECALAMAESTLKKFGTTYALSVTGIAGPDGGTREKPVGTIWIALAQQNTPTISRLYNLGAERSINRERSSDLALELLRRRLLNLS